MTSAGEQINGALRLIGALAEGEVPSSETSADALMALNQMLDSWNTERAVLYRRQERIPADLGTAVNVVQMVFGNKGDTSGTGVCFTRDPNTGANEFYGDCLINAQGEDVVAGIRTPQQVSLVGSRRWAELALVSEDNRRANYPSLEELMPDIYQQLLKVVVPMADCTPYVVRKKLTFF